MHISSAVIQQKTKGAIRMFFLSFPPHHPDVHSPLEFIPTDSLETPIPLHQPRSVPRHPGNPPLRPEQPDRPPQPHIPLDPQPELRVRDPQHQQRSHGPIQHLAVRAIEFRHAGQNEGEGGVEPLFVFDALVDDAVGEDEEVGGEGEGPGACYCCFGRVSLLVLIWSGAR